MQLVYHCGALAGGLCESLCSFVLQSLCWMIEDTLETTAGSCVDLVGN